MLSRASTGRIPLGSELWAGGGITEAPSEAPSVRSRDRWLSLGRSPAACRERARRRQSTDVGACVLAQEYGIVPITVGSAYDFGQTISMVGRVTPATGQNFQDVEPQLGREWRAVRDNRS